MVIATNRDLVEVHAAPATGTGRALTVVTPLRKPKPGSRRLGITFACDIEPEPVTWAWTQGGYERLPAGSFVLVGGREGTGKSSFVTWMAAQITKGLLPGSFFGTPRVVLIIATEDSWRFTITPRLMAAGADLTMVGRVDAKEVTTEGDKDVTLTLPSDNDELERLIVEHQVAMVGIDPVMSALGDHINPNANREVRSALDPLVKIADRTGAIIPAIVHFKKGGGSDIAELITGSGAFKDISRATLTFMKADDGARVMTQVKNSLGECDQLPSLTYTMDKATVATPKGLAGTVRFTWGGESDRSVQDLITEARQRDQQPGHTRSAAGQWVIAYLLACGGTAPAAKVYLAGAECSHHWTDTQLQSGRKQLKNPAVTSTKAGSAWVWSLDPLPTEAW